MIVYTASTNQKNKFIISAKLGAGGEGTVYAVEGDPDICVKIYHEQKRTPELEAKLKAMIDAPPKDPTLAAGHYSICWPTNVVYEDEACTKFLGFTMPRIDKNTFKEYHLLCDKPGVTTSTCYRLEHFGTGFTYLHMYVVALNLASCVASIHNAGHAIGDLNDKNILVSTKDSKITIVDCDSFEIHAQDKKIFPCSVYMPEYSAPEVIQRKDIKNRQESDRFALSILIFKLLMLNTHPYASRGSSVEHLNTPGEKIASGYYPYEEYADLDVNPPAYALPYDIIPPNIKALFRRCFVEGQHEPEKRPSATEWVVAIKDNYLEMSENLRDAAQCEKNQLHNFPLHLSSCPWCAMKEDYFPKEIITTQKYRSSNVMDGRFDYLDSIIQKYTEDNQLTQEEYYYILQEVSSENVTQDDLKNRIDHFKNKNPSLLVGDEPLFSEKRIEFGRVTNDLTSVEKIVLVTNNFIDERLRISFTVNKSYVTVYPKYLIVEPSQQKEITVTLSPPKIFKSEHDRTVEATIEAMYSMKGMQYKSLLYASAFFQKTQKEKIALVISNISIILALFFFFALFYIIPNFNLPMSSNKKRVYELLDVYSTDGVLTFEDEYNIIHQLVKEGIHTDDYIRYKEDWEKKRLNKSQSYFH